MRKNYYIQVGDTTAKDIFADFGVIVKETSGLNLIPDLKSIHTQDWPDEQGDDVYFPDDAKFKSKEVSVTFLMNTENIDDIKDKMRAFLTYLIARGDFSYFDTLKKEGFRGYYKKSSLDKEIYRTGFNYIEFTLKFDVPNGICQGYSNAGGSAVEASISKGTADFYFSDGSSELNQSEDFLHTQYGGFTIVCPSVYGGAVAIEKPIKIFGINGKIFGINGKIFGI